MRTEDGTRDDPALLAAPCFTMCEETSSATTSWTRPLGSLLPKTVRLPDTYGAPQLYSKSILSHCPVSRACERRNRSLRIHKCAFVYTHTSFVYTHDAFVYNTDSLVYTQQ